MLKDRTKWLFANTLMEMVETMPLEKVRVRELCERCGADRQTFYYHFSDKYDLAAWIYIQDYESSLTDTDGKYTVEHAAGILRRMKDKEVFYRKALSDKSQNAISQYLYEYYVKLGTTAVCADRGTDKLPVQDLYAIKSHAFACVGHTMEWLEGKAGYTPMEFALLQYTYMPDFLKKAYGIET